MKLRIAIAATAMCVAITTTSSQAANGTYTQILCANPDTGVGVGVPEELRVSRSAIGRFVTICHGVANASSGIRLSSGEAGYSHDGNLFEVTYEVPTGIILKSGTLFRFWRAPRIAAHQIANLHGGASGDRFGSPSAETLYWQSANAQNPWTSRGVAATPFTEQNAVAVPVGGSRFWRLVLGCSSGQPGPDCDMAEDEHVYQIFGGKMVLADGSAPAVIGDASGSLATGQTVSGLANVRIAATDSESGLYRTLLVADGAVVSAQAVDVNGGRCVDVNPTNADPHEFAQSVPCRRSATVDVALDTRILTDGVHDIKVQIEDAGGNITTALHRSIKTHNGVGTSPSSRFLGDGGRWTLSLKLSKSRLRNGQVLRYSGRLVGGDTAQKFVDVQVRRSRNRWQVVCSVQTDAVGAYSCRHRFTRTMQRVRYVFRARVRSQAGLGRKTIVTATRAAVVAP